MNHHILYPEKNYVVWDLETSGLDPRRDRILEIGWLTVRNGSIIEQNSVLLNHPDFVVPQIITDITGITTDLCRRDGVPPQQALADLQLRLDSYPNVTHNGLRFDLEFLLEALFSSGMTVGAWERFKKGLCENAIDTAALYKAGKLGEQRHFNETFEEFGKRVLDVRMPGLKYNVGFVCDELGIDKTAITQHRALGDVQLTHEIYKKLRV